MLNRARALSRPPSLACCAAAWPRAAARRPTRRRRGRRRWCRSREVEARDVPVEVRAPVDLRPLVQADVGSKTLGYLDAVLVDRGDRVTRGQLLALVRPSDLPDQLAAARSTLAQAQSSAALARTNYERAKQLAPEAVVSQQELQQAQSQFATAEAAQQAAQSQIAALAVRLGETRITSPLTGVVVQRRLDPGALVGPPGGGAIVTVARVDTLRVFITVNERELAGVARRQGRARRGRRAPRARRSRARSCASRPTLDPATRTLDAEVQLDNRAGELYPGMYGRGAIVVETHPQMPVVPVGAVVLSNRQAFAFVVDPGRRRRPPARAHAGRRRRRLVRGQGRPARRRRGRGRGLGGAVRRHEGPRRARSRPVRRDAGAARDAAAGAH